MIAFVSTVLFSLEESSLNLKFSTVQEMLLNQTSGSSLRLQQDSVLSQTSSV